MIIDTVGRPIPPSGMVERLQKVHPNLGLRAFPTHDGYGGFNWGITYRWEPNDPRWRHVQEGKVRDDEAIDVITFLAPDCPVDQAFGYFVNGVKHGATTDIRKLLEGVDRWNKDANKEVVDQALADAAAGIERDLGHFAGKKEQKSYGGLEPAPVKRPRGRPRKVK